MIPGKQTPCSSSVLMIENNQLQHSDHVEENIIRKFIKIDSIFKKKSTDLKAKIEQTAQYETNSQSHTLSTTSFFPVCMASQWFLEPPKNVGDSKINSRKLFNVFGNQSNSGGVIFGPKRSVKIWGQATIRITIRIKVNVNGRLMTT